MLCYKRRFCTLALGVVLSSLLPNSYASKTKSALEAIFLALIEGYEGNPDFNEIKPVIDIASGNHDEIDEDRLLNANPLCLTSSLSFGPFVKNFTFYID
jgi:hypothetical protein